MPTARSAAPSSMLGRLASELTSPADVWLGVRVLAWALVLPVMKQLLPIRSLASAVHAYRPRARRNPVLEARIVTFARWAARIIRWRDGGNCLERGLLAYRFLGLAGARPQLVVGLDREQAGDLIGHAWVLLDGHPVGESPESLGRYTPVFAFDPDGRFTDLPLPQPGMAPDRGMMNPTSPAPMDPLSPRTHVTSPATSSRGSSAAEP